MAVIREGLNDAEAIANLLKLSNMVITKRLARKATRKAAKPMYEDWRARLKRIDRKSTPNKIWKNAAMRARRTTKNSVGIRMGVRGGAKAYKNGGLSGGDTYYWRFLEFGTKTIRARGFTRMAFNSNVNKSSEIFRSEFKQLLRKELD